MGSLKIGDYFKETYESEDFKYIKPKQNVIIRLDGVAFHTYTKQFKKPFDMRLSEAMVETAKYLCENIHGCVMAYTQSDEISLLINDFSSEKAQPWFGYKRDKVVSVATSMCTVFFNDFIKSHSDRIQETRLVRPAFFDARILVVKEDDIPGYFKWRLMDALRNSKLSFGTGYLSHKQLHGMNTSEIINHIKEEFGFDWIDLPQIHKQGTFIIKDSVLKNMYKEHYDENNPKHVMTDDGPKVRRSIFMVDYMPDELIEGNPDVKAYFDTTKILYKNPHSIIEKKTHEMTKVEKQSKLIELLKDQIMDLTMMSKIELGDDVIEEIKKLDN